ncbi:MAG: hypothetical protein ABWZ82_08300 [Candidatus Limnocylindrales bacterium]
MARTARLAVVLGTALAIITPSAATADTPVSHRGTFGPHALTDTLEYPGATCRYDDDLDLVRVRVRPPIVFARDRTSARDLQWVGWVVELQYRPDEGSFSTIQRSSVVKVMALDDAPAPFRQRTVTIDRPRGSGSWRVVSRMIWYRPGTASTWQGTARHRVTFYDYPLAPPGAVAFCPAGIL